MAEISFKTKPKKVRSRKLPNALRRLGNLPVELDKIGVRVVKNIRRNASGRYLNEQSGDLKKSWGYVLQTMSNLGYRLSVESDFNIAPYSRIHDLGGMTGRGHKSKMKKTSYASRGFVQAKTFIKRILKNYMARLFRG